jgi:hypothetical protein
LVPVVARQITLHTLAAQVVVEASSSSRHSGSNLMDLWNPMVTRVASLLTAVVLELVVHCKSILESSLATVL